MSFAALRASLRKARVPVPTAAARTRLTFRANAFRKYSTETSPPAPKSNTVLYAGIGAAALGGVAWYIYASDSDSARVASTAVKSGAQAAKVAVNFVPTKDDYVKVGLTTSPPFTAVL